MPIRFRCPHCSRLLGIASRKAGSQTQCPQCGRSVTVPIQDTPTERELLELDNLLKDSAPANGTPPRPAPVPQPATVPDPEPAQPAVVAERPRPIVPTPAPVPAPAPRPPAPPRPAKKRRSEDDPLFEQDVDEMLGLARPNQALELDDDEPRAKPVSGMDAMSLDDGPSKIILSPQKAMLLVIAAVILVGLAFAAGFLIRSNI